MNFYTRHIGDYLKDTAHLTLLEHGVYTRLMDVYYTREQGIPQRDAARLIGARTKEEKAALASVLEEFFFLDDDAYTQTRCEREIEAFHEGEVDRDSRKENAKERQRRARERRKVLFSQLREHDIVPSFDTPTHELEAQLSRVTGRDESRVVTPPVTRDNTATHYPLPITQEKPIATHPTHNTIGAGAEAAGAASSDPEEPPPTPEPEDAAPSSRRGELAGLLRGLGVVCTYAHPVVVGWANGQGVTDDEVREAVAVARMQKGDAPIPVKYLVPIVEEMRRPKAPATPRSVVTPQWWASEGATLQEALRLGLTPHRGEEMPAFRDRIRAAQQSAKSTTGEAA